MNEALYAIWQAVSLVCLPVIGYFLKKLHERIDSDMDDRKREISALRDEITALKTSLPLNYVLREDSIRSNAAITNKLDNLMEKILEKGQANHV